MNLAELGLNEFDFFDKWIDYWLLNDNSVCGYVIIHWMFFMMVLLFLILFVTCPLWAVPYWYFTKRKK